MRCFARFRALGLPIHKAAIEGGRHDISPENARRLAQRWKIKARVAWLKRIAKRSFITDDGSVRSFCAVKRFSLRVRTRL
jgi:hypothetical protein